ncbi:hypothetical protein BMIN_1453 [Bifidobacterium minimum]|uniref:Uncharacterized protein n=1 Tax=Bifidobacterium minimum TaxID=1693 RepID=A0A087BL88_9BIFI|nr:hypothetical protein BMIN_1453 [Bifidobacterium minimum]
MTLTRHKAGEGVDTNAMGSGFAMDPGTHGIRRRPKRHAGRPCLQSYVRQGGMVNYMTN